VQTRCISIVATLMLWTPVCAGWSMEDVWITNPTSGVELRASIMYPDGYDSDDPDVLYPGIVLVPGGAASGGGFFASGHAQSLADRGVVTIFFDPDGRGQSTNDGTYLVEDYCGYLHQDGLHAVLQHLEAIPGIDPENIGVQSRSYGITMAAGSLGRYPDSPRVKYLLEWEGPADRTDTAAPNGHVPVPPSDDAFWLEREPGNFIDDFGGYVLIVQSENDHVQPDNAHTVLLNNRAVHQAHGGAGRALWARINDGSGPAPNPINTVWSLDAPPNWLPEWVPADNKLVDFVAELVAMDPRPCEGDVNGDDLVNVDDALAVIAAWQAPYTVDDLLLVLDGWGGCS
jgi:hypothetical protein